MHIKTLTHKNIPATLYAVILLYFTRFLAITIQLLFLLLPLSLSFTVRHSKKCASLCDLIDRNINISAGQRTNELSKWFCLRTSSSGVFDCCCS